MPTTLTITLTVQSAAEEMELYDAFAGQYHRPDEEDNPLFDRDLGASPSNPAKIPNRETKALHFQRKVREYVEAVWSAHLTDEARKQAEAGRKKPKVT